MKGCDKVDKSIASFWNDLLKDSRLLKDHNKDYSYLTKPRKVQVHIPNNVSVYPNINR